MAITKQELKNKEIKFLEKFWEWAEKLRAPKPIVTLDKIATAFQGDPTLHELRSIREIAMDWAMSEEGGPDTVPSEIIRAHHELKRIHGYPATVSPQQAPADFKRKSETVEVSFILFERDSKKKQGKTIINKTLVLENGILCTMLGNPVSIGVQAAPADAPYRGAFPVSIPGESETLLLPLKEVERFNLRFGVRCYLCGCTETEPCAGGCYWVGFNKCSRCYDELGVPKTVTAGPPTATMGLAQREKEFCCLLQGWILPGLELLDDASIAKFHQMFDRIPKLRDSLADNRGLRREMLNLYAKARAENLIGVLPGVLCSELSTLEMDEESSEPENACPPPPSDDVLLERVVDDLNVLAELMRNSELCMSAPRTMDALAMALSWNTTRLTTIAHVIGMRQEYENDAG